MPGPDGTSGGTQASGKGGAAKGGAAKAARPAKGAQPPARVFKTRMAFNAFKAAGAAGGPRPGRTAGGKGGARPAVPAPQSPPAVSVEFVLGAASPDQFPEPLCWEAAFMGRSNSGKSSMLNRLLGRKSMARVSSEPGRTREINFFRVVWRKGGEPFYVADFPGYGFARAPRGKVLGWGRLAGSYLAGGRGQKSFLLVDIRRRLGEDEHMLLELLGKLGSPAVLVATKCDKLPRSRREARLAEWRRELPPGVPLLAFSSLTGEGREELILEAMPPAAGPDGPGGGPEEAGRAPVIPSGGTDDA